MDSSSPFISVELVLSPTDEVRELVLGLEGELSANYAPEQRHGLSLDAIFQPHIRFFVARLNGEAVGCGGVALFSDFAELKRMYVRPGVRGQGVADALISTLILEAAQAGLEMVRLETGTLQLAALRFYERNGFSMCGAFEPYASMPPDSISTSLFMERKVGSSQ